MALQEPQRYSEVLSSVYPVIAAFGGVFLLMVFLHFMFDKNKETHWLGPLEERLTRLAKFDAISVMLASRSSPSRAMVAAAIGGLGLVQMPISLVREHIAGGSLRPILKAVSATGVEVHAVWPRQKHLSPRVRYVVDQLIAYAAMGRLD